MFPGVAAARQKSDFNKAPRRFAVHTTLDGRKSDADRVVSTLLRFPSATRQGICLGGHGRIAGGFDQMVQMFSKFM